MTRQRATIGYCTNESCIEYARGVYTLVTSGPFICHLCAGTGLRKADEEYSEGNYPLYKEVRINYHFDAVSMQYRTTVIVIDAKLEQGNKYILNSPMYSSEKQMLKKAEKILAELNTYRKCPDKDIIAGSELMLCMGADTFSSDLQKLASYWR